MGGYASKCGAVEGFSQGLVCTASLAFKCIGVLSCVEMDTCNPPDMVAQVVLHWAGSCRQQLLHAGAIVQNTYVQCLRTAPLD
jgi:hypothetical protein